MRTSLLLSFLVAAAFAPAQAGVLDDIGKALTAPITAPFEATVAVIQGDDPTVVITDPMQATGRVIQSAADAAQAIKQPLFCNFRDPSAG